MKQWIFMLVLTAALAACGGQVADEEAVESEAAAAVSTTAPTDAPETVTPAEESEPTATAVSQRAAPATNLTDGCVTEYSADVDYFPEKVEPTYVNDFTVDYFNHYKVVTLITPFPGATEPVQYVLVQCGTPAPDDINAPMFEVPVQSFISMSTSYLPALEALDVVDALVGVDSAAFAYSEAVRARVDSGDVTEVGGGDAVNVELVIDLSPDVVMTSSSGLAGFDAGPKLTEVGVPVALNAEFLAASPLARAEWIEYIALFFNKEAAAAAVFSEVAAVYEELAALAKSAESAPTVFTDSPFDGVWYMAGGESFTAQLIADAGASYIYTDDDSTGSLTLDFETVFDDAATADYWINVGLYSSRDDMLAADERFGEFAAFQNGNIYNYDARVSSNGGIDYFESGVTNPHLVLADLIGIFHPDLLPNHEFVYYRQLPER